MSALKKHQAYWTCCGEGDEQTPDAEEDAAEDDDAEYSYYFAPLSRQAPPYLTQRTVMATIDIAADGTLAGIELIDDMPPPPPVPPLTPQQSSSHPGTARIEPAPEKAKDRGPTSTDDQ